MAIMANKKDPRAVAEKAIADEVKKHTKDGEVMVYPVLTKRVVAGKEQATVEHFARLDGRMVPPQAHRTSPEKAEALLAFRPPAWTLYESGNPIEAHKMLDEHEFEQAWGDDPATSADPVDAQVTIEEAPTGESKEA